MSEKNTLVAFIIDGSGSMNLLKPAVISGVNEYIQSLKQDYKDHPENGKIFLSLVVFSGKNAGGKTVNFLYNLADIVEVEDIKDEQYIPDGMTPLFDSVGTVIKSVDDFLETKNPGIYQKKGQNALAGFLGAPELEYKIICMIQTDGAENSSHTFTKTQISSMVKEHEDSGFWTFGFLGAGLDAMQEGMSLGMQHTKGNSYSYDATPTAMGEAYRVASIGTLGVRAGSEDQTFSLFSPSGSSASKSLEIGTATELVKPKRSRKPKK